ncbi:MAG TPA: hypothetical protein VD978_34030 [Azospirillum sp.]|nr:hypothetical protein [Azospirillum sp.]
MDDGTSATIARALASLQGVMLGDADAALCGRLLDAVPRTLAAPLKTACVARPEGTLFDVPPGAHAAALRGEGPK